MYRCSECNREYREKVDFCDCGNDEFLYIEDVVKIKEKKPLSMEQKSQITSWVFFAVCLLLSFIVWLIPIKSQVKEIKIEEQKTEVKDIPAFDKIWDSTPVKIEVKQVEKPVVQPVVTVTQPKQQVNIQTSKPKTDKKTLQTQQKKDSKIVKNNQTKNETNTKQNKKTEKKVEQKTQTQPKSQNIKKETKEVKETKQTEEKKEIKKTYNPNSPEMLKYKGELRAALFRRFPVGSIQGSGSCSVHFAIDSNGKLINRGFTKQSDNKSLNDAVYFMLMSVPKFKAPPEEYSGETINMTFTMTNGSYEITIK